MEDTYCRILILNRFRFYSKSCGSLNYYHEQAPTKISVNQKYTKYLQYNDNLLYDASCIQQSESKSVLRTPLSLCGQSLQLHIAFLRTIHHRLASIGNVEYYK